MKKDRRGYAIETSYQKYWAASREEVIDVSYAKIWYLRDRAEKALPLAQRRYPNAKIIEVAIGSNSQKRLTVNGYPKKYNKTRGAMRRDIWSKYGGRCAYCGVEIPFKDFHMDTYYPDKGFIPENMMPCCKYCFRHKHGKTPKEFQSFIEENYKKIREQPEYKAAKRYGLILESPHKLTFFYLTTEGQAILNANKKGDDQQ